MMNKLTILLGSATLLAGVGTVSAAEKPEILDSASYQLMSSQEMAQVTGTRGSVSRGHVSRGDFYGYRIPRGVGRKGIARARRTLDTIIESLDTQANRPNTGVVYRSVSVSVSSDGGRSSIMSSHSESHAP
jgi:hypothetical protein